MTESPGPYDAPTPRRFYIHDDISEAVSEIFGADSIVADRVTELFGLMEDRDPERVRVLTVDEQIEALVTSEHNSGGPYDLTLGIGAAGERVAQQLHERAGWFPHIHRIDVTRQEDGHGGYTVVSTSSTSLEDQLANLEGAESIAIVDDSVFSGATMRTVLTALPPGALEKTHAFCLQCVAESLGGVRELCPVSAGFQAEGHILEDVSFINASGLVTRVGIRQPGGRSMAFYERPEWIHAWFPGYGDEVITLARKLNEFLEPEGGEVLW